MIDGSPEDREYRAALAARIEDRETRQATADRIVAEFLQAYLEDRIRQLGQIIPGLDMHIHDHPGLAEAIKRLHGPDPAGALAFTLEPQEWRTMTRAGLGLITDTSPEIRGEIREICQSVSEWIFCPPGSSAYTSPGRDWIDTEIGAAWWAAWIWSQGDALITQAAAAALAGVTVQAISQRISAGSLDGFTDPAAPNPRHGGRLVRESQIRDVYAVRIATISESR